MNNKIAIVFDFDITLLRGLSMKKSKESQMPDFLKKFNISSDRTLEEIGKEIEKSLKGVERPKNIDSSSIKKFSCIYNKVDLKKYVEE